MSFRGDPQTTQEHIAYIYELLRRIRPSLGTIGPHNLLSPEHLDTDFAASKSDGDVPTWNEEASRWVPQAPAASGGTSHTHDGTGTSSTVVGGTAEEDPDAALAPGVNAIAIGDGAVGGDAGDYGAIAIGKDALARGSGSIAIGSDVTGSFLTEPQAAQSVGLESIAIGQGAWAGGNAEISIGDSANNSGRDDAASAGECIAIGWIAQNYWFDGFTMIGGSSSVAIGWQAAAYESDVAIGYNALVSQDIANQGDAENVGIGNDASIYGYGAVIVGGGSSYSEGYGVALGYGTSVYTASYPSPSNGIAIGRFATSSNVNAIAIGRDVLSEAEDGVAIGRAASVGATHTQSVAIGTTSATDVANQIMLGTSSEHVKQPGGQRHRPRTITNADGTAAVTDFALLFSTGNTNRTCNLPAVSGLTGQTYRIKKIDSGTGTVTIDGSGSETIDGATTKVLTAQYEAVDIICDGTAWYIL